MSGLLTLVKAQWPSPESIAIMSNTETNLELPILADNLKSVLNEKSSAIAKDGPSLQTPSAQ